MAFIKNMQIFSSISEFYDNVLLIISGYHYWSWRERRWQSEDNSLRHWHDKMYLLWLLSGGMSSGCHCWGSYQLSGQNIWHKCCRPISGQVPSGCATAMGIDSTCTDITVKSCPYKCLWSQHSDLGNVCFSVYTVLLYNLEKIRAKNDFQWLHVFMDDF